MIREQREHSRLPPESNESERSRAPTTSSPAAPGAAPVRARTYRDLKELIKQDHLLDRQPLYYTLRILGNFALLAVCVGLLFGVQQVWFQLLVTAPLMAFTFVQLAFVAHNSGHRQVGYHGWQDMLITHLHMGFLLGLCSSWWMDRHNAHHGNPNVHDEDPDIDFPFFAFREEEAEQSRGVSRFIIKYQALLMPLLGVFVPFSMRAQSALYIARGEARHPGIEAALMVGHIIWFATLLLAALPPAAALAFFLVHQMVAGAYLFSVFAANHKGMPVLDSDHDLDFLRLQVLTSRNVRAHPLTDFFYGGLNYQIEHHLFPTMPQNSLRAAQRIVKEFCRAEGIPYHETSFIEAEKEIILHLHRVSATIRAPRVAPKPG